MRIGAGQLLQEYGGTPLSVAEALIEGRIDSYYHEFVGDVVSKTILEAARIRIELKMSEKAKELEAARELERVRLIARVEMLHTAELADLCEERGYGRPFKPLLEAVRDRIVEELKKT